MFDHLSLSVYPTLCYAQSGSDGLLLAGACATARANTVCPVIWCNLRDRTFLHVGLDKIDIYSQLILHWCGQHTLAVVIP